jgi:hypothetical protein
MLTVTQWKQARRVDHVKVAAFNIRYRGNPDLQLKAFDQLVTDYHAGLTDQARLIALGEIIASATAFAAGAHTAQTQTPVAALATAAEQDLRLLLAGRDVAADGAVGELRALPATWGARQVRVNTWIVVPDAQRAQNFSHIDAMIDAHLLAANQLYAGQGMRLSAVRRNAVSTVSSRADPNAEATRTNSLLDFTPDPTSLPDGLRPFLAQLQASAGTFSMEARSRIAAWLNTKAMPASTVDLVYVPAFAEDDAQGLTTRPHSTGLATTPDRPYVTIGWNPLSAVAFPTAAVTFPTTLAHELLHALMDEGTHTADANNLMAGGSNRSGTNVISTAQMAVARNSTFM